MKPFLLLWLISLSLTTPAAADHYDGIYRGLVLASYRHMETAYRCRRLIGVSHYQDARVTTENSLRLSGMPTDIALLAVEKMVVRMQKAWPERSEIPSLTECLTKMRNTQIDLQTWQTKLRSYWR